MFRSLVKESGCRLIPLKLGGAGGTAGPGTGTGGQNALAGVFKANLADRGRRRPVALIKQCSFSSYVTWCWCPHIRHWFFLSSYKCSDHQAGNSRLCIGSCSSSSTLI